MATVTLLPDGRTFEASPGETVLDAALRAGIPLPYGCRNGACRSCAARVVDGAVSYPRGTPKALDEVERRAGHALLCAATARRDLVLEVEGLDAADRIRVRRLPCRVAGRTALAHDVVGLDLALPPGERLAFRAGQYLDILLRDGRRRAFSVASPPHRDQRLELHIRKVPGGRFSEHAVDTLREGALLRFEGPLGSFWLRAERPEPVLLVAGGTGFAPIKSIVEDALHEGLERPMTLYWGARARRDLYLHELAARWAQDHAWLRYVPVLSEPAPEDAWNGRTGLVHDAVLADHPDLSAHAIYMSGPPAMVDSGRRAFPAHGADPALIHSDSFDYAYETGHDG